MEFQYIKLFSKLGGFLYKIFVAQINKFMENKIPESDVEVPDESLADGDLKEHNIIDSVTYVYGFNTCHGVKDEWMVLVRKIKKQFFITVINNRYFNPMTKN